MCVLCELIYWTNTEETFPTPVINHTLSFCFRLFGSVCETLVSLCAVLKGVLHLLHFVLNIIGGVLKLLGVFDGYEIKLLSLLVLQKRLRNAFIQRKGKEIKKEAWGREQGKVTD